MAPSTAPIMQMQASAHQPPETIFYDGHCGLCHRWVKIVMKADKSGERFRFAPLQGTTIQNDLTAEERSGLPDSIIVHTRSGEVLVKTTAIVHILRTIGGWRGLSGSCLRLLPRPLRDLGYDTVACVRHRLFKKPAAACPLMPPEMQDRFLP